MVVLTIKLQQHCDSHISLYAFFSLWPYFSCILWEKVVDSYLYGSYSMLKVVLTFWYSPFTVYWPLFTVPLVTPWNSGLFQWESSMFARAPVYGWIYGSTLLFHPCTTPHYTTKQKDVQYIKLSRRFEEKKIGKNVNVLEVNIRHHFFKKSFGHLDIVNFSLLTFVSYHSPLFRLLSHLYAPLPSNRH